MGGASAGCPAEVDDCNSCRLRLETDWDFGSLDMGTRAEPQTPSPISGMTTGPPGIFQPSQIPFGLVPHPHQFVQAPVNVYDSQEQLERKAAELHDNAAALKAAAQHMRAAVKCMTQGSNPSGNGAASPPHQLCLSSLVESAPCNTMQPSDEGKVHSESRTTVLLRRLPASFSRSDLLQLLDSEGFKDCYDFVYLPMDFKKWSCFGYAFINLASHEEALRMWQHFDGFTAWPSNGDVKVR